MQSPGRWSRLWQSPWLSLGSLGAGVAAGSWLGPEAELFRPLSSAFLNLLTMLSMPFLVISLIHGLGSLSRQRLGLLARAGGLSLAILYLLSLTTYWALSRSFPTTSNASFYTDPPPQAAPPPTLLHTLIPSNPFQAIAEGVVPGVVFFCLFFAWHLVRVEGKTRLLDWLEVTFTTMRSMSRPIQAILPVATFFLTATAFGSLEAHSLARLEHYILTCALASALLCGLVLPLLMASATPVSWRAGLQASLPALLASFVTGSSFAALPLVSEACKQLTLPQQGSLDDLQGPDQDPGPEPDLELARETEAEIATILPVTFNFPSAGSLMTLFFVLFAATYYDQPLGLAETGQLFSLGTLALFSGSASAIRYLAHLTGLPGDAVDLFLSTQSLNLRHVAVISTSSLITLCVLTVHGTQGRWRWSPWRLGALILALLGPLAAACMALAQAVPFTFGSQGYYRERSVPLPPSVTLGSLSPTPDLTSTLDRIRAGQPLRVGITSGRPPFSYRDEAGALSGYSLALAARLAEDLPGGLILIELAHQDRDRALGEGQVDLILTPVRVTPARLLSMSFTDSFGSVKPVLVFHDDRRRQMERKLAARDGSGLRVGLRAQGEVAQACRAGLPGAELIEVEDPCALLEPDRLDALLWNDLEATAWEISNPSYDFEPLAWLPEQRLGYPVRIEDVAFGEFFRGWLELKRQEGFLQALRGEWVLGEAPASSPGTRRLDRLLDWLMFL